MNKKSSSFFRVDEQVFFTMGGLCILSLIIMAFRYGSRTPCSPVQIIVNSKTLVTGNLIRFDADAKSGKTFSWNFGDGTVKDQDISVTNHEYKNPGRYTVSLLVNGQCTDMQDVVITEAKVIVNKNLRPMISADPQDSVYVNQPVHFSDISSMSTQWAWRFGQTKNVDDTSKNPVYHYTVPGKKLVTLTVNGDANMTDHLYILVQEMPTAKTPDIKRKAALPYYPQPPVLSPQPHTDPLKPPVPEPKKEEVKEKPKVTKISADQLSSMLMEVADGKKRAEDFSEYLCGALSIQVSINGDLMPFSAMCEQLKHTKRIKRISALPTFNESNCVLSISVTVKKRLF